MKTFALGPILSVAAVAALAVRCIDASDALRVDGGEELGWDEDRWFVQVDGVMGGKSSGEMEFFPSDDTANNNNNNNAMRFTGDISLDGGGFSSVRRQIDLDLSEYAGIVITLEADARNVGQEAIPPTGLHLQLGDSTSYYDFSSAFAIPLSSSNGNDPVVTSVYLPIESFDRATSFGFECRGNCNFNPSNIDNMSVYVLFQEGSFDVRLRSIEAVGEPRSFPPPTYDALESSDDIVSLLRSTISSGGGLYDLTYVELCIAMYWSVLNTILASAVSLSDPLKVVICAGLEEVEYQMDDGDSKANIAWTLRHAMDAVIADLRGSSRTTVQDWLPTASEAASMEVVCEGRTSAAMGLRYDPTNESILVSTTTTSTSDNTNNNNNSENDNDERESPNENDEGVSLSVVDEKPPSSISEDEEGEFSSLNDDGGFLSDGTGEPLRDSDETDEGLVDPTFVPDEAPIDEPNIQTTTAAGIGSSALSSGSPSRSGRGFESVVGGILLLLGVVQLV